MAEAKERLSYVEAMQWVAYTRQRGSLNVGMRVETHLAQAIEVICSAMGVKKHDGQPFTADDFMSHADESTEELSFEDAVAAFQKIGHGDGT